VEPHSMQNRVPGRLSVEQLAQIKPSHLE